jgi:hypothetical protein
VPNEGPRNPNQPLEKPEETNLAATLAKLITFLLVLLAGGAMVVYSLQIQVWPWAWTNDNWHGFLTFSGERVQNVQDKINSYDWYHLKTRITEKTQQLWNDAPGIGRQIEEKLANLNGGSGQNSGQGQGGSPPSSSGSTPEHQLALQCMRDGISHYRKSPDDPSELLLAKKSFEEAQGHFEKALKEAPDEGSKSELQQELTDCNKYLEDCRAREKT